MRLWEAIIRGAEKHKQCHGTMYGASRDGEGGYHIESTCAQGAALVGLTLLLWGWVRCTARSPGTRARDIHACWVCGMEAYSDRTGINERFSLWALIPHLNDAHNLTRPAIAMLAYRYERQTLGANPVDDAKFVETFPDLTSEDYLKVQARTEKVLA